MNMSEVSFNNVRYTKFIIALWARGDQPRLPVGELYPCMYEEVWS